MGPLFAPGALAQAQATETAPPAASATTQPAVTPAEASERAAAAAAQAAAQQGDGEGVSIVYLLGEGQSVDGEDRRAAKVAEDRANFESMMAIARRVGAASVFGMGLLIGGAVLGILMALFVAWRRWRRDSEPWQASRKLGYEDP